MKSSLLKLQPASAMNESELYAAKAEAWNQKCISDRILVLNNDQIAKLSNKEFECVVNIGNRLYKGK